MNTALKVDDYWLIVQKGGKNYYDFIMDGDTVYSNGEVFKYVNNKESRTWVQGDSLQVISASKEGLGLPVFDVPDEWEDVADEDLMTESYLYLNNEYLDKGIEDGRGHGYEGFQKGYNKAKEKYQFTEEDMLEFGKLSIHNSHITTKQLFKEYKTAITKPKQYEVEIEMEESPLKYSFSSHASITPLKYQPKITEGKVKILTWKEA